MRTLYIDCGMGAAGDMLTAALLELLPDPAGFAAELNALGIPGVTYVPEPSVKCGVRGTHMSVLVRGQEEHEHHAEGEHEHHTEEEPEHHHHSDLRKIGELVSRLPLSGRVREDVLAVYALLAEAESAVHGVPPQDIHFHEVGTLDAVADITAVCMLMERLAPDEVIASPVHVGSGQVRCAHGILPVPAPATAQLLKGIPVCGGGIEGELCTPTGAVLLRHFVSRFGELPAMRLTAVGYGMGKKDFPRANCVRAMLGESGGENDTVAVLTCNVDDMTAEDIGFAMERLFDGGAKEVFTVPAGMKKNRPGTLIEVICSPGDRDRMAELLFRHTTTLGIREALTERRVLARRTEELETEHGSVRVKLSEGFGVTRRKYEYDDLARIARALDIGIAEVRELLERK